MGLTFTIDSFAFIRYNQRLRAVSVSSTRQHAEVKTQPVSQHAVVVDQTWAKQGAAPDDVSPLRVLIWTGHSGPFHDHIANGKVLADALNSSQEFDVHLGQQEELFVAPGLHSYDILLIYADTYENPLRGNLSAAEWDGLFDFVKSGGGLFALHTASACWMNHNDSTSVRFHHEVLNAEFGGHSPYKDYISRPTDPSDPIVKGMAPYVVTDELYHPVVFDLNRSVIFMVADDVATGQVAVHGLRHTYGSGRVLYFAQGHDMAEFETPEEFQGNHAFQAVIVRCLRWLGKVI